MSKRPVPELRQFSVSKYLIVGLFCVAVDYGVFLLLLPYLQVGTAGALSAGLSSVISAARVPYRPPRHLLLLTVSLISSSILAWWALSARLPFSPYLLKAALIPVTALLHHRLALFIYRLWRKTKRSGEIDHLSVVIPAYNEARRLPHTLARTVDFLRSQPFEWQIIVVNDGSQDDTPAVVTRLAIKERRIKLLSLLNNRGKGGAVQAGIQSVHEPDSTILIMDADNSTPVSEVQKAWPALNQGASVVIGTRYRLESSIIKRQPWPRRVISRGGNLLIQLFFLPGLNDTQCGFKCFTAQAAQDIFAAQTRSRFSFDVEAILVAKIRGYRIVEVPVIWENDPRTTFRPFPDTREFLRDLLLIKLNLWSGRYF